METTELTELLKLWRSFYFEENELINADFAKNILSWKNSGFSIDNSVRIFGSNDKARESLAQYSSSQCGLKKSQKPKHLSSIN